MNDGFSSCVCHKGVMWDTEELSNDGHCPQYAYEREQAMHDTDTYTENDESSFLSPEDLATYRAQEEADMLAEAYGAYAEDTFDPDTDNHPWDTLEEQEV